MKELILHVLCFVFFEQIAMSQNKKYPNKRIDPVDSVSQRIDSLISQKSFYQFTVTSPNVSDSSQCTRHYYIDTKERWTVKCVFDTTFEDYNKTKFKQVVVYFYKGYEFNALWIESQTSKIGFGYSSGDFLKDFKSAKNKKLEKNWTKQELDYLMRKYVADQIGFMKFMQKRNFGG